LAKNKEALNDEYLSKLLPNENPEDINAYLTELEVAGYISRDSSGNS